MGMGRQQTPNQKNQSVATTDSKRRNRKNDNNIQMRMDMVIKQGNEVHDAKKEQEVQEKNRYEQQSG